MTDGLQGNKYMYNSVNISESVLYGSPSASYINYYYYCTVEVAI